MDKPPKDGQKWDPQKTTTPSDDGLKNTQSAKDEMGQIDNIIGHFGKYQLMIFIFKILIGATSAFNNLGVTFFAPTSFIGFSCATIDHLTTTDSLYSSSNNVSSLFDEQQILLDNQNHNHHHNSLDNTQHQTISDILESFIFSEERRLKHSQSNFSFNTPKNIEKSCDYVSPIDNKQHKCTSYNYDTGIWISTIIDEWNLVCDRAWLVSFIQSLYMSGFIVSFLMFGYLSDRFGRWRSLLLGAVIEIISGFGCAFANSVTMFMIFRFLLGLGNAGRSSSSYLVMIEWVGPKWRMHISTLGSMGWVLGYCSMPWITLYYLHFRHMQLFICFYELVFVIWLLCLPESPRWLLIHKRFDEAYEVLLMAAKFNGLICENEKQQPQLMIKLSNGKQQTLTSMNRLNVVPVVDDINNNLENNNSSSSSNNLVKNTTENPTIRSGRGSSSSSDSTEDETSLKPYTIEEYNLKFSRLVHAVQCKDFTQNENKLSFIDLFRWKNLRKYSLILFFVWAADSFIYYGIALGVGGFGGSNLFVSFTWAGITEIPSMAFTIICMKLLPRRTTNLFIFTAAGLICALQLPLKHYNYHWLQQSTMLLAKLFNTCSFTVILYQTMELFPTSIRQTAYSSCSLAGRIGSILAPFIKELAQLTNDSVAPIMYALLCFLAALFIKDLPETKGSDLPDTLLEAENFQGTDIEKKKKKGKEKEEKNTKM